MSNKECKERYFKKVYENANEIDCACGCGTKLKDRDHYGRPKKYINGHNGRKYDDPGQFKREWNHRNRKKRYEYKKQYLKKRKTDLIEMLGGKCQNNPCPWNCEYDGNNAAMFDFHHVNPELKEFDIAPSFNRRGWEEIVKEVKKCILLCSNCHRILHNGGH